ncbi:MAG: hypothetical protein ACE5JF_08605 [Anaerolineales bacterium]
MTQDQTIDSADLLASLRSFLSDDRPQRFIIGFLFAASLILIEAGLAEVLLARNEACLANLESFRLAPDPYEACMSEFGIFLARSMSQGLIGTLNPEISAFAAWFILALLYGFIGGGLAQLPVRWAIAAFLIVHVILLMVSMSLGYLSQFIILDFTDPT